MERLLVIDPQRCNGCRTCEIACSLKHEGACDPTVSRIRVISFGPVSFAPIMCQHCEKPVCERVCPVRAIHRNPRTNAMQIDENTCVGCRLCMVVCPVGGISIDPKSGRLIQCDLCEGDPLCVKFCATEAIRYVRRDKVGVIRKREGIEKLSELLGIVQIKPLLFQGGFEY